MKVFFESPNHLKHLDYQSNLLKFQVEQSQQLAFTLQFLKQTFLIPHFGLERCIFKLEDVCAHEQFQVIIFPFQTAFDTLLPLALHIDQAI
ncbi:hypothetical protein FGO68_gene4817 [Halteria grandinella]|uniref:Uncharacterized protein n=1 Tax=Halteria grandinella TaxID=5974 RepID=A0A8J8NRT4_HALGN|nr:hypothetical protein FGO68_gene4817 [Halteria grandinella]